MWGRGVRERGREDGWGRGAGKRGGGGVGERGGLRAEEWVGQRGW